MYYASCAASAQSQTVYQVIDSAPQEANSQVLAHAMILACSNRASFQDLALRRKAVSLDSIRNCSLQARRRVQERQRAQGVHDTGKMEFPAAKKAHKRCSSPPRQMLGALRLQGLQESKGRHRVDPPLHRWRGLQLPLAMLTPGKGSLYRLRSIACTAHLDHAVACILGAVVEREGKLAHLPGQREVGEVVGGDKGQQRHHREGQLYQACAGMKRTHKGF
jgi:hypothetical protein